MCHRAEKDNLRYPENIKIPDLVKFIDLNENIASVFGTFSDAKCIGISLNTSRLNDKMAKQIIKKFKKNKTLPATDPIRYGVKKLWKNLIIN